jgi:hypothetical protein
MAISLSLVFGTELTGLVRASSDVLPTWGLASQGDDHEYGKVNGKIK